jgi:hypothetical protein
MLNTKIRKWAIAALCLLLVLSVGGIIGYRMALGLLKGKVVEALGPGSEIGELQVGWSAVEVGGLRIQGPRGWPATDALRAERVAISPSLRSLFSDQIQVGSITVRRPYISALRPRDGKLQVVPSLLAAPAPAPAGKPAAGSAARSITISRITLEDGVVELFDATVAQPPTKIRLERIQATVGGIVAPALTGKSHFDLTGLVKGVKRDGQAKITGWSEITSKDSSVQLQLRAVDLVVLQPYLLQASETRVHGGALDFDLNADVRRNRLRAPGKVILADLELGPSRGALDTFMGVPRGAVVNFLKDKDNKITVNFIIEGDLANPRFTLNEALATRVATSLAENMGVSLRGVAAGVEGLGRQGVEAAGKAGKGVGETLERLLGGRPSR